MPDNVSPMPAVGQPAPDFTLHSTPDQTLWLSQLRGHPVVLAFYDAEGIVRWSYVSPSGINPGADGILEALEKLPSSQGANS